MADFHGDDHTYSNRLRENRRQNIRDAVAEYKVSVGCSDCGYNKHSAALVLLHDGPTPVSRMISNGRSREQILAVVSRSICVCANCNLIRKYNHEQAERPSGLEGS